jgi:hypothetical protein
MSDSDIATAEDYIALTFEGVPDAKRQALLRLSRLHETSNRSAMH